ncbi:hypothetical protein KA062_00100 [Patescibacteria group bacterium]|jgi:uncharacterized membrane protein|nr:hypothetical protein [Patescibacteria group bacterium]
MSFLIGFILAFINIISILGGFLVYHLTQAETQKPIQIISACTFSIVFFLLRGFLFRKIFKKKDLKTKKDYFITYISSLLLSPLIFITLHYISEGYLTSAQNIYAMLMFQVPTNLLVLIIYKNFSKVFDLNEKLKDIDKI